MAHILDLLDRHGYDEVIANLHYFPDTIRDYFGDRARRTARRRSCSAPPAACATAPTSSTTSTFLVISGDALTDIDLGAFVARHNATGGIATLAVKRVENTSEFGVVLHDADGRITGFQEKPDPAEALSDLGNCGIYMFEPEIFDYFPRQPFVDWAHDVFPALLENDVPFHVHEIDEYWNDVGSLQELKEGTFDAMLGELRVELDGDEIAEGVRICAGTELTDATLIEPPVWIGRDVTIGAGVRLQGPLAIGDGATIGANAALKDSVVLPGTEIAPDALLIGAIAGHRGIVDRLRPRA